MQVLSTYSPIEFEIQHRGEIEGLTAQVFSIFGYRTQWSSTTLLQDVAPYLVGGQQKYNIPNSATTYYAVSTSTQDSTAGTGVDRIRVVYLDAAGELQATTVSLNGTTPVSIGTGFSFIEWMESYHSTVADREAVGAVTISSVNGVAGEADTIEMIRATGNRSESLRFKVPTGKHMHLLHYKVSALKLSGGGTTDYQARLRATVFADDAAVSNAYHFLETGTLTSGSSPIEDYMHYREIPAGAIVKLSVTPTASASGNTITASLDFILVDAH